MAVLTVGSACVGYHQHLASNVIARSWNTCLHAQDFIDANPSTDVLTACLTPGGPQALNMDDREVSFACDWWQLGPVLLLISRAQ